MARYLATAGVGSGFRRLHVVCTLVAGLDGPPHLSPRTVCPPAPQAGGRRARLRLLPALPLPDPEANATLRRLTDNRIQVAIESLRDLEGGGRREILDLKIAGELGERWYDLYSGGEALRTDFAERIEVTKDPERDSRFQIVE